MGYLFFEITEVMENDMECKTASILKAEVSSYGILYILIYILFNWSLAYLFKFIVSRHPIYFKQQASFKLSYLFFK